MTLVERVRPYRATARPVARVSSGLRWVASPAAIIDLVTHEPGPVGARLAPYRVTLVPVRLGGESHDRAIAV